VLLMHKIPNIKPSRATAVFVLLTTMVLGILPVSAFADETISLGDPTSSANQYVFGRSGDIHIVGQKFTPSDYTTDITVTFDIARTAAETDNVRVDIEADVGGHPSGVSLGSAQIAGTSVANVGGAECDGAVDNETFPTISGLALTSGTTYWAVLSRTGSLNTYPNTYVVCRNTNSVSDQYSQDDSTWSASAKQFSGYLDLISGTPPEPPSTEGTATSTVNQTEQNTFNGVLVFMLSMFFVVWFFKKR